MPRKARTDLQQALLDIDIKKAPHVVRRVAELLDLDASIHAITKGRYADTVEGDIHPDAVANIKRKLDLVKEIFRKFDTATSIAEVSDADNRKDIKDMVEGKIDHFENARIEGGIDTLDESRIDPFSAYRLEVTEAIEEKVPYEHWSIHYLRSIGFVTDKALAFVKEYDAIRPHRIRAKVGGDHPRLAKFRSFERWLDMHYENYLRSMAPTIKKPYLRCAVKLISRGVLDTNIHLEEAGYGIVRYAIWESEENHAEYYEFLRGLHRTSQAYRRFKKRIEDMLDEEIKNEE